MKKKFFYGLNTGLTAISSTKSFSSDKEAWNDLAKDLDARYKTGGHVVANLEKYGVPIFNIHEKQGLEKSHASSKQVVAIGVVCFDWDGTPWNNPTFCGLCGCEIPSELYRTFGYCKKCEPVVDSLTAWKSPFYPTSMMHGGKRVKANITKMQLDKLKETNIDWYLEAMFLLGDGTLTLLDPPLFTEG